MRRMADIPLQTRIGALVVAGLIIIFALFGILGWSLLRQNVQRMVDERLVVAQLATSLLDVEIAEQFEQLERAAPLAADAIEDSVGYVDLRDLLFHQEPFVASVFFVDRSGRLRWTSSPERTTPNRDVLSRLGAGELFDGQNRYVSGVQPMGTPPQAYALLAVPSRSRDGAQAGALVALLDANHASLRELISGVRQLGNTGHAELVDQDGVVVASTEAGRSLGPGEHPSFYRPLLAKRSPGAAITEPIGDEDPSERGQRHAMAFAPLQEAPWGLTLGGTEAELFVDVDRWRWQILLLGGLAVSAALALVWITIRSVAQSVTALTLASQRIGAGDLATPVPDTGEGEVHTLAESLDDMRRHLREVLDALAFETSRYQAIVGSMADAVFTTDSEGRVTAFNRAAEVLTGWRTETALGRAYGEVLSSTGESGSLGARLSPDAVPLGVPRVTDREVVRRRDGRSSPVAHVRSAIRDANGGLVGEVHVLRDVSDEEELERLKDQFLSMISHELRTPLGHIKGYATTLLLPDAPGDDSTRERCLRVIVEASDELEELVDNLLDMSKIGAGAFAVDPRPIRLRPLVHAAVERARFRGSGHRLLMQVPAKLPLVLADARRIEQVLHNLLDNATKYSPCGGDILVTAEVVGSEVVVGCRDEGIGIPADELGLPFNPFYRCDGARANRIGGSGLGLAICKGIVEAHKGRIWAASPAPERPTGAMAGTLICFSLPILVGSRRRQKSDGRLAAGCAELPVVEVGS